MSPAGWEDLLKKGLAWGLEEAKRNCRPLVFEQLKRVVDGARRLALIHQLWVLFSSVFAGCTIGFFWFLIEPWVREGHFSTSFGLIFFGLGSLVHGLVTLIFFSQRLWWRALGLENSSAGGGPGGQRNSPSNPSSSGASSQEIEAIVLRVIREQQQESHRPPSPPFHPAQRSSEPQSQNECRKQGSPCGCHHQNGNHPPHPRR
jgi:hypothetical protein